MGGSLEDAVTDSVCGYRTQNQPRNGTGLHGDWWHGACPNYATPAPIFPRRSRRPGEGAVVNFLVVVRGEEEGKVISAIEYEAFEKMVTHQFNLLFDEMAKRWPVESVRLVHRIGVVKVNEPSLWVEILAPHRGEAFAACLWLIDEMKRVVPIWKKRLTC
jgi:molybdopterin synthase catalytic subunit